MSNNPPDDKQSFDELRHLLLGPELKKLETLADRLESPEQFSSDIGEVLPQAMQKSAQHGEQLSEAMVPTVEEIVRLSIKRDINKFASALYPVIGPAIRKSIAETIRQMLQSLNQVLEHGLSWRGIKWRIESIRTGIPFAQIVLLNSLEYRVEQVFLIHRHSGILLNHVEQDDSLNQNADMVSSMLSAIGDFVSDSFDVENPQQLDSIRVGDFSIFIEQGPGAVLAVASRGNAPKSLRNIMVQVLEDIQSQFDSQLSDFKGNTAPFEPCRGQLLLCMMQSQQKPEHRKLSLKARLIWITAFLLFFYWLFAGIYLSIQQQDYVDLLKQEPGFIITDVNTNGNSLSVKGLRDPLARDPQKFIALVTLDPDDVDVHFEPYQSLQKPFIRKRLLNILNPPDTVDIQINANTLTLSGFANAEKVKFINTMAPMIAGIDHVDTSALHSQLDLSFLDAPESVVLSFDPAAARLTATGSAPLSWRKSARQLVANNPLIQDYDDSTLQTFFDLSVLNAPDTVSMKLQNNILAVSGTADNDWIKSLQLNIEKYDAIARLDITRLSNSDQQLLKQDIELLENEIIFFDAALSFNFEAQDVFNRVTQLVRQIISTSRKLSQPLQIIIKGHSDSVGQFQNNVYLSLERADYVAQYLFNTGISPQYILIKGLEAPVKKEKNASEQRYNRRVTFKVQLNN